MQTIWFIRHGESTSNAGYPTRDPVTIGLTARGLEQSQVVAELLPRPDLVITSPHHRTLESARPTLARYPESLHEEWLVQEFTYLDAARYMNSTLHQRMPHAAAYWQRADPTYRDGTAESFAELVVRLDETRARLAALPHRFVVMFTHGLFTRAMLWRVLQGGDPVSGAWMGQAYKVIQGLRVPNAAINPSTSPRATSGWWGPCKPITCTPTSMTRPWRGNTRPRWNG